MLLEVINSVFLTYIATEYLLVENDDLSSSKTSRNNIKSFQQLRAALFTSHQSSRSRQYIFLIVLSTNILVNFHTTGVALAEWIHNAIGRSQHHFHVPRILVAICSFLLALFWDCRQKYKHLHSKYQSISSSGVAASSSPWSNHYFLQQLLQSFCRLLPVYPFLAVIISFGFLFVITAFERLHLPLQILNMPIYYGTLYG
jgi:hypothetical protein